jgi:hypothetical protein
MPRYTRFFPVSHDINADTEVWELTDKFGMTGLRAWLEILSIADRNEGQLPGLWSDYPRLLSARCKSTTRHLVDACQFITRWLVVDSQGTARVANYWKYHRRREPNQRPPNLTQPNLTKEKIKNKSPRSEKLPAEAIELAQLLSDKIFENTPNRTPPTEAQLNSWAVEADKINRIDRHPWPEIRTLLVWAQADPFWKSNILSMSKFREQWNQLLSKSQNGASPRNNEATERVNSALNWRPKHDT